MPAEAPESRGFADRPCILGRREQQQTPRAATRRGAVPARGSAPQPEASPLAAQLTSSSLTQVEGRTLLQMTLPAKGELCAAPHRDRRVSVSPKRAPAGGGVSFTQTLPPELELPSAGVVESGMSKAGSTREGHNVESDDVALLVFTAHRLGGLMQGASGSDPSTRKPRTGVMRGQFFLVVVRIARGVRKSARVLPVLATL